MKSRLSYEVGTWRQFTSPSEGFDPKTAVSRPRVPELGLTPPCTSIAMKRLPWLAFFVVALVLALSSPTDAIRGRSLIHSPHLGSLDHHSASSPSNADVPLPSFSGVMKKQVSATTSAQEGHMDDHKNLLDLPTLYVASLSLFWTSNLGDS